MVVRPFTKPTSPSPQGGHLGEGLIKVPVVRVAIAILLALPAFLGSANAARAADCPASSICGPYPELVTNCTDYTVPQQSRYFSTTFAGSLATSQVAYDLVAGTIQGSSQSKVPAGAGSIAAGVDDFNIVGVPSGLPAQIVASIHVVLMGQADPYSC